MNLDKFLKKITPKPSKQELVFATSGVQFNLVPDVKRDSIKGLQLKNQITKISYVAVAISLGLAILLALWVNLIQKGQLNSSAKKIQAATANIKAQPDLTKAITIQNQLSTLVTLHASKHISSRVFGYLSQLTPSNVNITQLNVDHSTNTMTISGTADSAAAVNQFIDTLKFAKYTVGSAAAQPAFSSVIESSFSLNSASATFSITTKFDPTLFTNDLKDDSGQFVTPKLQVPGQVTTRSVFGGGQ